MSPRYRDCLPIGSKAITGGLSSSPAQGDRTIVFTRPDGQLFFAMRAFRTTEKSAEHRKGNYPVIRALFPSPPLSQAFLLFALLEDVCERKRKEPHKKKKLLESSQHATIHPGVEPGTS